MGATDSGCSACSAGSCPRRPNNPGLPSYDTLHINSSGLNQERLAPLIVALLTEIKEARYRLHRIAQARQSGAYLPPTVLALDETANIAPIPDLPPIISQGVVVVAVFHHLAGRDQTLLKMDENPMPSHPSGPCPAVGFSVGFRPPSRWSGPSTGYPRRVDGRGRPLVITVTPGQSADSPAPLPMLGELRVPRVGPGRPTDPTAGSAGGS